ncbi:hypothetical protein AYI70_g8087 [Smittium culicis]|uniref:Uncharacterized protein n=1 Tax=Smittium culicis TaxID=133412 RepID=A0A1R1XHJ3_9FUNG|nr:hypothetical protein AYI70_g8087 [Smittium culicis]
MDYGFYFNHINTPPASMVSYHPALPSPPAPLSPSPHSSSPMTPPAAFAPPNSPIPLSSTHHTATSFH